MVDDDEAAVDAIFSSKGEPNAPSTLKGKRAMLADEVIRRHYVAEALHHGNQARQRVLAIVGSLLLILAALVFAWWLPTSR